MTFNIRGQIREMARTLRELPGELKSAVLMVQEARRLKTTQPGGWRVYKPPAAAQSGLAVLVPKELQTQVGDAVMRQWWMALRIGHIVWVNVHWPVVKKKQRNIR